MVIRKVVIPAAGLGTRLLPMTKEFPKEMLPVFFKRKDGKLCLKPILQAVFEQLYDAGGREFCFVVGRGKRAIEDHFTPDWNFVEYLKKTNKAELVEELQEFYRKIYDSTVIFINQPEPKGFGDAVLKAKVFTQDQCFLVHAGDDLVLSKVHSIKRLSKAFMKLNADAFLLVEKVEDPTRYGVIQGTKMSGNVYRVTKIVEKPEKPPSNIATIAVYAFKPSIYREIENTKPDKRGEVQLSDAIQRLIDRGCRVYALELERGKRIEVGTSENYLKALSVYCE